MVASRVKGQLSRWQVSAYAYFLTAGFPMEYLNCLAELDELSRQAGVEWR